MDKHPNGPLLWSQILDQMPKGSIVAGGAVRDYLLGVEPKDIDVFFSMAEYPEGGLLNFQPILGDDLALDYTAVPAIDTVQRKVIGGWTVDAIGLVMAEPTPLSIVSEFDFAITRSWFDGTLHDTVEAGNDRAAHTVTRLIDTRPERSRVRFERFNARMGGDWSYVIPAVAHG